jgi:murein DD-endopeptidase MepM/ murein hydrolase activator NlpD
MKSERRWVTIVVHRDGDLQDRIYRVPARLLPVAKVAAIVAAVLIVIGAILYAPIVLTAARVPGLNSEIRRLTADNERVRELEQILGQLESRYDQVRNALGADALPVAGSVPDDRLMATAAYAVFDGATAYDSGPSLPVHWPIDTLHFRAFVTRGQVENGPDAHRGIDIAVRVGTPIRSAGGGTVRGAGFDAQYGLFVQIDHPDGYQTMYGHASRLLVQNGDHIEAGQIIALSGNTGRSTAPHLHFERRRGDQLVDPFATINPES